MIYVLGNSWSVLDGITPEIAQDIERRNLDLFCAPRPLANTWWDDADEFHIGYFGWDKHIWHYAFGDKTYLQESWRRDDAKEVRLIDENQAIEIAENILCRNQTYIEGAKEVHGKDWFIYTIWNSGDRIYRRVR